MHSMKEHDLSKRVGEEVTLENVQRSGMFGKLVTVTRENSVAVTNSLRSSHSYRSSIGSVSGARYSVKSGERVQGAEDATAPPQHASWPSVAAIMVSEVVGAGVLTLSQKYAQLGWILPSVFIVLIFFLVFYTSMMMVDVKRVFPGIVCLADAADYTFGGPLMWFTQVMVCIYLVATMGDYLLLVGKSLGSTMYDIQICFPLWVLIGAGVLLPIVQLRTLNSTAILCLLNMISICCAIALVIAGLVIQGRGEDVETNLVAENMTFMSFMQALSAIFFTFGGQFMFYELMAEMKDYQEFPKTFSLAGPFQVPIYLIVGCVGYYFKGAEASGYFLDNLGFGTMYRAASALLCFHMLVAYLILGSVLSRMIHLRVSPYHVNDLGWRGKLEWFLITSGVLVMSYLVANAVPFFEELTSLIGGVTVPTMNLILPLMFYAKTRYMIGQKLKIHEWIIYSVIIAFAIIVTVCSTIENFRLIISHWSDFGAPFSCHCQDVWETCECSPSRMLTTGFNCSAIEADEQRRITGANIAISDGVGR
jgi:amino acid permease